MKEKISDDKYKCIQCGDVWGFCPEDYENPWDYPTECPLCTMPLHEMIRDVYQEEGIVAVVKQVYKRYKI